MKLSNVKKGLYKYGKLTAKPDEEISWDKLCVDIIGKKTPYKG